MLGRYASQDMDKVSEWPMKRIVRRVRILSKLVDDESGSRNLSGVAGHPRP